MKVTYLIFAADAKGDLVGASKSFERNFVPKHKDKISIAIPGLGTEEEPENLEFEITEIHDYPQKDEVEVWLEPSPYYLASTGTWSEKNVHLDINDGYDEFCDDMIALVTKDGWDILVLN